MTPCAGTVVVKVGGSLLTWSGLVAALTHVLQQRSEDRLVLIPGGGEATEAVRRLDQVHQLGQERAHALALRSLDLTAYALATVVPGLEVVTAFEEFRPAWDAGRVPVLAPREFLEGEDQASTDPLPRHWDVTSDSIAARVARRLNARELILLKSVPFPQGADLALAVRAQWVDPWFPIEAKTLPKVTWVNLRDRDPSTLVEDSRVEARVGGVNALGGDPRVPREFDHGVPVRVRSGG